MRLEPTLQDILGKLHDIDLRLDAVFKHLTEPDPQKQKKDDTE
jgi:hypothetical protein